MLITFVRWRRPRPNACGKPATSLTRSARERLLAAGRRHVFSGRDRGTGGRVEGPDIATPHDVATRFATEIRTVIGAGVALYPDEFSAFARTIDTPVSARDIADLAADRVRDSAPPNVMEPIYLRRPDA